MQVYRRRKRKRGHPILAAGGLLVLMAGISFGAATLWQNMQETGSPLPQIATEASEAEVADTLGAPVEAEHSATPPVAAAAQQVSPAQSSAVLDEPEQNIDPTTSYTVDWQVKASEGVQLSYFDDAVFFGDSVSTGLSGYHIVDNAACYAAVGVSPHTALTSACIGATVNEKKTLLDAAKEVGERGKVYIMLGGNGLWMEQSDFVEDYQTFLEAVRQQYPEAVIYLQSMTPVGLHVGQTYPDITKEKVIAYNSAIAALAKQNGVHFVNVFEGLMDENGDLPAEVSPDGLHLSPEYYYKWLDYLKTHTVEDNHEA